MNNFVVFTDYKMPLNSVV